MPKFVRSVASFLTTVEW